jgi:hypothetical protein
MAERIKDKEDLKLESMFRPESIADDGFSVKIMSRVRRHMWVRRLSLPLGISVGVAIAAKPLLQIAGVAPNLLNSVAGSMVNLDKISLDSLPQTSTMIFGITLLMAVMFASRLLEE